MHVPQEGLECHHGARSEIKFIIQILVIVKLSKTVVDLLNCLVVSLFSDFFTDIVCHITVKINLQVIIVSLVKIDDHTRAKETHDHKWNQYE